MKKIILYSLLLVIAVSAFSQTTKTAIPQLSKADYFQKSKNQRKVAQIIIFSGAATSLIGLAFPQGPLTSDYIYFWGLDASSYKNDGLKTTLVLSGLGVMLSSIPFFIVSSKNKRKALMLSLKNETAPIIYKKDLVAKSIPSVSIKLSL